LAHVFVIMACPTRLRFLVVAPLLAFVSPLTSAPAAPAAAAPIVAMPRFTHPGTGQTMYFVLTDRFANGSTANDLGGGRGGPNDHGFDPTLISHFQGGDFTGMTARLDYLKDLGITAVWVTPPFKNKPVQKGAIGYSAGYHGYWILDFLQIDPHLGTNAEFQEFVKQAHARGMRVIMDIIVNHTADVIQLSGDHSYRESATAPYRDAAGAVFDPRKVAFNGLNDAGAFPALDPAKSFAYVPTIPAAEVGVKNPAWLNDITLYHNRGNSTFAGESATHGDFVGLDDVFTEHPQAVKGFVEIFSHWIESCGVDGFRIDTARHVNTEFWQAFIPAIRARARELGRPDFIQFGEVYNDAGDPSVLAEFSTSTMPIDTTIDFGFFAAARRFVSQGGTAAALADFFARDDYYTDHDSNVHSTTTFIGNHDAGRFGYFLQQDNPGATPEQLAALSRLGHGLLYLARGQPVLYYGDEQGMIGRGGNDMQARESMFAAQAPDFKTATLLATTRTGADDKFDPQHPFYQLFARLGALRAAHVALRTGAMIQRTTSEPALFAFSRIDRGEKVEYLVALNSSRSAAVTTRVPTSQPKGAKLTRLFDSRTPDKPGSETLTVDADGSARVTLEPLQFAVWRAAAALPKQAGAPHIALATPAEGASLTFTSREVDALVFPSRREIRAEVSGGDGVAEVTFTMQRLSRPGQYEWLGTDDAPPYRVFWNPPADLAPGDILTINATVDDLRGQRAATQVSGITAAPGSISFGIRGATAPRITSSLPARVKLEPGKPLRFVVEARGTPPLEYQWYRDGREIAGATSPTLEIARAAATDAGTYRLLVRNRAGTTLSTTSMVGPDQGLAAGRGRIDSIPTFTSRHVAARPVDVWLPPGYDTSGARRFPVIYMQDGQSLFDDATSFGGVAWDVDGAVERLMKSDKIPGAIIVGIGNTPARSAEYFPQKAAKDTSLATLPGLVHRTDDPICSDAYLKFVVEELKPFIDATYRTLPDRAHTFVAGSSMGGLISAYALVEYPEVFGGAACLSTHWPAGDGAVVDYISKNLPKPGEHRIYFDHGTATLDALYEPFQQRMDEGMKHAGYTAGKDWVSRTFPGEDHSERAWSKRVEIPLLFLLR
jgi:glycosidase/enterochelin esterase-like enzyme